MILKPCPFCGSEAIVIEAEDRSFPYRVQCMKESCACRTDNFTNYEGAIKSWNKRICEEDELR